MFALSVFWICICHVKCQNTSDYGNDFMESVFIHLFQLVSIRFYIYSCFS